MSKGTRVNGKHKPADLPAKFRPGFVGALDNRTLLARALRRRFEAIASDLGGLLSPGGRRKRILIAYLDALKKVFPDAWTDEKGKAMDHAHLYSSSVFRCAESS